MVEEQNIQDNKDAITPEEQEYEFDASKVQAEIKEELTPKIAEEVTQQVRDEVTRQVQEDFATRLTGKSLNEDAAPWVREGRNPKNYEEVAQWGEERALKKFEKMQSQRDQKQKEESEKVAKQEADKRKNLDQYWNEQIQRLEENNEIPKISDDIRAKLESNKTLSAKEQRDPGVQARTQLYQQAREAKESNLELIYYRDVKPNKTRPGVNAPIFGAQRGAHTQDTGEVDYSYEEIHNARSFADLIK